MQNLMVPSDVHAHERLRNHNKTIGIYMLCSQDFFEISFKFSNSSKTTKMRKTEDERKNYLSLKFNFFRKYMVFWVETKANNG